MIKIVLCDYEVDLINLAIEHQINALNIEMKASDDKSMYELCINDLIDIQKRMKGE